MRFVRKNKRLQGAKWLKMMTRFATIK